MPTSAEKLEDMLKAFEKTNTTEGANLRKLLKDSPELEGRLIDAIDKGNLEKFEPLTAAHKAMGAVGVYRPSDKTIFLPLDYLKVSDKDKSAANLMLLTFGHEVEHAINRDALSKATDKFKDDAKKIAEGPSPHDYTNLIKDRVDYLRDREARDEMAGLNVLAAKVKRDNPTATKEQLYEKLYNATPDVRDYFDVKGKAPSLTYEPKAGISFNDKFQLEATTKNVEAFEKYFFDGRGYPELYGKNALRTVGGIEATAQLDGAAKDPKYVAPEVKVNLKELGLTGATLPAGFTDSSPRILRTPDDPRGQGHQISPQEDMRRTESPLFQQSLDAVEKLGETSGLRSPQDLKVAAAAMAAKAQTDGLDRIDAVLASNDGKGLIAVQGDPATPQAKTSYIDRESAMQQPMDQMLAQLNKQQPASPQQPEPQMRQGGMSV